MSNVSTLLTSLVRREVFDPKNVEHKKSLKKFLETGNWGEIQFHSEMPYVTVPETVFRKFAAYNLRNA